MVEFTSPTTSTASGRSLGQHRLDAREHLGGLLAVAARSDAPGSRPAPGCPRSRKNESLIALVVVLPGVDEAGLEALGPRLKLAHERRDLHEVRPRSGHRQHLHGVDPPLPSMRPSVPSGVPGRSSLNPLEYREIPAGSKAPEVPIGRLGPGSRLGCRESRSLLRDLCHGHGRGTTCRLAKPLKYAAATTKRVGKTFSLPGKWKESSFLEEDFRSQMWKNFTYGDRSHRPPAELRLRRSEQKRHNGLAKRRCDDLRS